MSQTEFDIIERYFRPLGRGRPETHLGVGDDAALLRLPAGQDTALAMDTLVAGVHFPEDAPADAVGHKALAVNLSDLAAMGATPVAALLSLTLPDFDARWLAGFADGFGALAGRYGVDLIGGDTTRGPLSVTVQVVGSVAPADALRRAGARPGDTVMVSGSLGDAALGLDRWRAGVGADDPVVRRLHYPEPRLPLATVLRGRAHACIDISDGLIADLGHVLAASGVGARIVAENIPLSPAFYASCPPQYRLEYALSWGDDYELCACVASAEAGSVAEAAAAAGVPMTVIGEVTREPGLALLDQDGRPLDIRTGGYRHFDARQDPSP